MEKIKEVNFSDSSNTEVVEDSTDNKSFEAFKARLDDGLEFYRKVSGEDAENINIHPETQLFFSCLNEEPIELDGKATNLPALTEYGLKVSTNLYEFKESFRNELLRYEAERHIRFAENLPEFYDNLEEDSSNIRQDYIEEVHSSFVKEAQKPYREQKIAYTKKINSYFLQNSVRNYAREFIKEDNPKLNLDDTDTARLYTAASRYVTAKRDTDSYEASNEDVWIEDKAIPGGRRKQTQAEKAQDVAKRRRIYNQNYQNIVGDYKDIKLNPEELMFRANREFSKDQAEFIKSNYMTPEEHDEFISYSGNYAQLLRKIPADAKYRPDIMDAYNNLVEAIKVDAGKKFAENNSKDDIDFIATKRAFFSIRQSKYDGWSNELDDEAKRKLNLDLEYLGFERRNDENNPYTPVDTPEEALKSLENLLLEKTGLKDPYNINQEIKHLSERHFYELAEKYQRGKVKFGTTTEQARMHIRDKNKEITDKMRQATEKASYELAEKSADSIGKKVAELVFEEEDVKDAYFTPVGCFVRHVDDHCTIHPVSPFDARIEAALGESEGKAWMSAWGKNRKKITAADGKENPAGLVDFINKEFRDVVSYHAKALEGDSYDQLSKLREELKLNIDGIFDRNGKLNHLPTSYEVELLGEVMPSISRFVGDVTVNFNAVKEDGFHQADFKGISKNLQHLISGQSGDNRSAYPSDLINVDDSGVTLNFYLYQKLLHESNYNKEATKGVLYSCLGYGVLSRMEDDKIKEFSELLGDKANVSKQSIYRNYGIMVNSPLERRRIAINTYFVSEFTKYALGTANEKMTSYFDGQKGA